jgi:F-type H+-transporting ATPase subunit b
MDNPLVQPDPGLFIWTILTFLVLLTILAKFAWRPLLQALEARQETIKRALADADQAKSELERLQRESTQLLQQARVDAAGIVEQSRSDAERVRDEIRQKAKTEADAILRNAEQQIQAQTRQALQQIRHEVADLSVMIASKVIERNLTKEDNAKLIADTLTQLETGRPSHAG